MFLSSEYKILLASKSPRRSQLLKASHIPFEIVESDIPETFDDSIPIDIIPQYLSHQKATRCERRPQANEILLTADTLVIQNNKVLGKPSGVKDATQTLLSLSGTTHKVITGITMMDPTKTVNSSCLSIVEFETLTKEEINDYINHYQPMDKAGSYGIQDWIGICKIKRLEGSYHNIMGLPTHLVYKIFKNW